LRRLESVAARLDGVTGASRGQLSINTAEFGHRPAGLTPAGNTRRHRVRHSQKPRESPGISAVYSHDISRDSSQRRSHRADIGALLCEPHGGYRTVLVTAATRLDV